LILDYKNKILFSELFKKWSGENVLDIEELPVSGSKREYFRIKGKNRRAIGVFNANKKENEVFLKMARFFQQERIPVPEIYGVNLDENIYIQQDLGDQTLFSQIQNLINQKKRAHELKNVLKTVLTELCRIQIVAGRKMDFSICYPVQAFGKELILKDLEYFRDNFLNRIGVSFDLYKLNKDFEKLAEFTTGVDSHYFMYRDFQSRNILINDNDYYFLDFQGGMEGPLQYDVVSFLFQARARIPQEIREELLEYYFSVARMMTPISEFSFFRYYYAIALIRVLQTLGAYGLRGLQEGKLHFIRSIPFALDNLDILTSRNEILKEMPELNNVLKLLRDLNKKENGIEKIFNRNHQ
jgi:aminoglycoside/choline kinase family phosphotransferase